MQYTVDQGMEVFVLHQFQCSHLSQMLIPMLVSTPRNLSPRHSREFWVGLVGEWGGLLELANA